MRGSRLTKDMFIKAAKEVHGDAYDYSSSIYINNYTKIKVLCKKHGEFYAIPKTHLQGIGCMKCFLDRNKFDTEEVIRRFREVHGDKYDYSKMKYVDSSIKVAVTCKQHGEFLIRYAEHYFKKRGCPTCSNLVSDTKSFVEKAIEVHGGKYTYEKANYVKSNKQVLIGCPTHGYFKQRPNTHLSGSGCSKCSKNLRLTLEEFVCRSNKTHGSKYNYDSVKYKNNSTKVDILCPEHGYFRQTPNHHMNGNGCPLCAKSGFDVSEEATFYVYKIGDNYIGYGISNDFSTRDSTHVKNLAKKNLSREILYLIFGDGVTINKIESSVKEHFNKLNTDIGVDGFRKECIDAERLPELLAIIEKYE